MYCSGYVPVVQEERMRSKGILAYLGLFFRRFSGYLHPRVVMVDPVFTRDYFVAVPLLDNSRLTAVKRAGRLDGLN
jgi:hypothetical protein